MLVKHVEYIAFTEENQSKVRCSLDERPFLSDRTCAVGCYSVRSRERRAASTCSTPPAPNNSLHIHSSKYHRQGAM